MLDIAEEARVREDEEAFTSCEGMEIDDQDQLAIPSIASSQSSELLRTPSSRDSDIDPWRAFASSPSPPFLIPVESDQLILDPNPGLELADPIAEDTMKDEDENEGGLHPRDFLRALHDGTLDDETLNGLAPITLTFSNGCQHVSAGLSTNPVAPAGEDGCLDDVKEEN
ncbi:hypothetical protein GQ53DRAFT_758101 [Thozetella sp. PMI_491]|nr:hypothetical protein GQ53DRAFT_758101 [Thozetella sp. PMI_491]